MARVGALKNLNNSQRWQLKWTIYHKDHGICQICQWPIDTIREASLDHYPIKSRDGGSNKQDNLRIAHVECNMWLDQTDSTDEADIGTIITPDAKKYQDQNVTKLLSLA